MNADKNFLVGVFDDDDLVLNGVRKVRENGVKIHEVFSPFPVHGLDQELGYRRTRLPIAAFSFGLLGTALALIMQMWMLGVDWPMIIGGKDFIALPAFIPVTFELTVLLASLGMVGTFLIVSGLKPYAWPRQFDLRSTEDKHIMAIDLALNKGKTKDEIASILKGAGASEVNEKNFD